MAAPKKIKVQTPLFAGKKFKKAVRDMIPKDGTITFSTPSSKPVTLGKEARERLDKELSDGGG